MVRVRELVPVLCFVLALLGSTQVAGHDALPARSVATDIEQGLRVKDCRLPGLEETVRCGTFEVFEDRKARTGRRLSLAFVVLPARGAHRQPDPVFFFAGGPGESAVNIAAGVGEMLAPLREDRDIVLIDQRGT